MHFRLLEISLPVPNTNSSAKNATVNATANATVKLNKTQKKILYLLHENKNATYEEIAKQLDIERTTVWRNIDAMKKKAVLRRVGEDKNGHWEVLIAIENVV